MQAASQPQEFASWEPAGNLGVLEGSGVVGWGLKKGSAGDSNPTGATGTF